MTIAQQISALQQDKTDIATAITNKGGTVNSGDGFDDFATDIATIPAGGGDTITATNTTGSAISEGDKVWLEESSGSWNIVNFITEIQNFNIVGSPSIDSTTKVASGFSPTDYIQLSPPFNPSSSHWEIRTKITTPNDVGYQIIFQSCVGTGYAGRYSILFGLHSGHFTLNSTYNGSSWMFNSGPGSYNVQTNTTYWIKFGWDGSYYYLKYSLDGVNYTTDINRSGSATYSNLIYTYIGIYSSDTMQSQFFGTIDLSETSIIIGDDTQWWSPYTYDMISSDAYTGVAAENIASGSTGDVNTVLPSS